MSIELFLTFLGLIAIVSSEEGCSDNVWPASFRLVEKNTCYNFWHDHIAATDLNGDNEFAYFQSVCPSFSRNLEVYNGNSDTSCLAGRSGNDRNAFTRADYFFYDTNDNVVASLREATEDILINAISVTVELQIFDKNNDLVGYSLTTDFFDTSITIRFLDGSVYAASEKTFSSDLGGVVCVPPYWTVTISSTNRTTIPRSVIAWATAQKAQADMHGSNEYEGCTQMVISAITIGSAIGLCIAVYVGIFIYKRYLGPKIENWRRERAMNKGIISRTDSSSNNSSTKNNNDTNTTKNSTNMSVFVPEAPTMPSDESGFKIRATELDEAKPSSPVAPVSTDPNQQ